MAPVGYLLGRRPSAVVPRESSRKSEPRQKVFCRANSRPVCFVKIRLVRRRRTLPCDFQTLNAAGTSPALVGVRRAFSDSNIPRHLATADKPGQNACTKRTAVSSETEKWISKAKLSIENDPNRLITKLRKLLLSHGRDSPILRKPSSVGEALN